LSKIVGLTGSANPDPSKALISNLCNNGSLPCNGTGCYNATFGPVKQYIMKKHISILVLILSFVVFQGCGSKTEINDKEQAEAQLVKNKNAEVVSARKAKLVRERAEKEEQRKQALEAKAKLSSTYKDAAGNLVYYKAEVDPSYAGGQDELMKFLKDNLKYPEAAKEKNIEGTVFVEFVINANGKVREVTASDIVGEDVDFLLKEEAVRVVAAMPGWKAGRQQGKTVDVSFSIPITFEMVN
jgi:TonB family protein